ncbi:uncharacterized protein LOC124406058 [Diprion similis]|uniref:uncharacterized protein LOC124406058 n=1 Tax=Diprion similis TaxID=362088 RepID=UPI001EF771CE|nr:uncharacterized protein LOC124406058 [Diprion similis]
MIQDTNPAACFDSTTAKVEMEVSKQSLLLSNCLPFYHAVFVNPINRLWGSGESRWDLRIHTVGFSGGMECTLWHYHHVGVERLPEESSGERWIILYLDSTGRSK